MRILLTGTTGQVGSAFLEAARDAHEVVPTVRAAPEGDPDAVELPLHEPEGFAGVFAWVVPDVVVHAGAMTHVDRCEEDPERAMLVNARATEEIAELCESHGARLVHVSTDYVFDGAKGGYTEDDPTGPINAYGRSKLAGEQAALRALSDVVVARTAVVYDAHHKNFVRWVAEELEAGRTVRAATDQRVSPTYAPHLAETLLTLVEAEAYGVFHAAGADALTRFEMATAVAEAFDLDASLVEPISMDALPWKAPRPADTSLDVSRVAKLHPPRTFQEGLEAMREARTGARIG